MVELLFLYHEACPFQGISFCSDSSNDIFFTLCNGQLRATFVSECRVYVELTYQAKDRRLSNSQILANPNKNNFHLALNMLRDCG